MDPSLFNNQGGQFYFMKTFCPSSTPAVEFSNPGTCNVKLHSIFSPLLFRSTEKVLSKETVVNSDLLQSKVQKGGSASDVDEDEEMFKYPIKVSKTILLKNTSDSKSDEKPEKKRSLSPHKGNGKKKKFSFKVVD